MAGSDAKEPVAILLDGVKYLQWPLECPDCGDSMPLIKDNFGIRYKCKSPCRGSHGAHPDGKPLGTPANSRIRKARSEAHLVFDVLWQSGKMSRVEAYAWMRSTLRLQPDEAHISSMNVAQCRSLIQAVQDSFPDLFPLSIG